MVVAGAKVREDGWLQGINPDGSYNLAENYELTKEFKANGVITVCDMVRYIAHKHADKECLGTRQILIRHTTTDQGKHLEKLEMGDYQWTTYRQMYENSQAVTYALKDMGFKYGDRIGVFAETRAEWLMAATGILQQRVSVVTLYTSLSDSGVLHAMNETEIPLVFTTYDLLPRVLSMASRIPKLKTVVVMEDQLEGIGDENTFPDGLQVYSFKQFIRYGQQSPKGDLPTPLIDDTAIIMYTSGSTGTPKGVEIMHSNILAFVLAYSFRIPTDSKSRFMGILPLAHILELVTELACMALGIKIFYSSPGTFTSSSPKVFPGTDGDAKLAKPTIMNCVPLVLDKVIKSVTQKVEKQGWLKSFIFKKLVNYKFWIDYIPITSSLIDYVIFKKVKVELGGELKNIVVGGAPLSVQTQESFRAMFGCNLLVGYGSTESSACVSVMSPDDQRLGHVGPPNCDVLVKLDSWEEGGYRVTDKPHPRGEIIIGGPSVAKGYFKRPEETAANFFVENGIRCFRTGDIGKIDEHGCISIIDRMKDLIKMKHGEYISLGHIESVLKTMNLVENICVFTNSLQERAVAVVQPVPEQLLQLGLQISVTAITNPDLDHMKHLYTSSHIKKAVLEQLQQYAKQSGLNKYETPAAIYLTSDVWNPESGLVTAALKLKRKQLYELYHDQVQAMYASQE